MNNDNLLNLRQVRDKVGLGTTRIYELMKLGQFPQSMSLGARCTRWSQCEVQQWIQEKKDARPGVTPHAAAETRVA